MRRHHRTTPCMARVLGSLLLVAAAGAFTSGAAPAARTAASPLDRVIPAPASVTPGGSPYRVTRDTRIGVDRSQEARQVGEYLAGILRPSTGYRLPVTTKGPAGIQLHLHKGPFGAEGYRLDSGGKGVYYTKADYKEIVRYAASRYLEVVPEIDMPGHTNAALASYAELNCDGKAPPLYTGTDVGFSSLCAGKDVTYSFVDDVIRELAALTPGRYLHIGGDEAHSTSHEDYVTFMDRVQPVVAKYGKTVIGWHQITGAHPVKGAVAQYWGLDDTDAAEKAQVAKAAQNGTGLVLSPADRLYLDMKYTEDTPLGQDWAGLVEVRRSYDWDPGNYLAGAPGSAIRGVEAPLWTETIVTSSDIDYMAFPRLPGAAELGWSPASTHDWDSYKVRLAAQAPRWEALGISYYRSPQVPW
jgi:hexosaminidase